MVRILLGDFGEVFGGAIRRLLDPVPQMLVTTAESITPALLEDVRPDVVILDLDSDSASSSLSGLSARFPQIAVIACSADEALMMVFPVAHGGEFYVCPLTVDAFATTVANAARRSVPYPAPGGPGSAAEDWSSASPSDGWNPVVFHAAQLRLTAKLLRARGRQARREAVQLQRIAHRH